MKRLILFSLPTETIKHHALHFVDYEIAPHYNDAYKETLEAYRRTQSHKVKPVTDAEYIVIDR